jgi:hypothetical protein
VISGLLATQAASGQAREKQVIRFIFVTFGNALQQAFARIRGTITPDCTGQYRGILKGV